MGYLQDMFKRGKNEREKEKILEKLGKDREQEIKESLAPSITSAEDRRKAMTPSPFGRKTRELKKINVIPDKEQEVINKILSDETDLRVQFEDETGKRAMWRNRETKAYITWKETNV